MEQLLLHPQTSLAGQKYLLRPSSVVIFVGGAGSGKRTLAQAIARKILQLETNEALKTYPFFWHITRPEDKQEISIDTVRQLISRLKLKSQGSNLIRRVALIENADDMSLEAQNAALKILEEPPDDTIFLMTALSKDSLLPTIVSRSQVVEVVPVSLASAHSYYSSNMAASKIDGAWHLSGGHVGLLNALLLEQHSHPLTKMVTEVKRLLKQPPYQRLIILDRLARNKLDFKLFLAALDRVLTALQYQMIDKNRTQKLAKILVIRRQINELERALDENVLARLALLKLVTNLEI